MVLKVYILLIGICYSMKAIPTDDTIKILSQQVDKLQNAQTILTKNNRELFHKIIILEEELVKMQMEITTNRVNDEKTAIKLKGNIDKSSNEASRRLDDVNSLLNRNSLYILITFLSALIISLVIYFYLRKNQKYNLNQLTDKIIATKKELEEESVKLDTKLVEIFDTQLKVLAETQLLNSDKKQNMEIDHSLALKVADNIARIKMNLSNMDSSIKGHKQLMQASNAIIDNFKANGYEIIDLLNKPYDDGMKVTATMELDEKLKPGEQIIRRIIKPQVNYNGVMIQAAQIVVAYNE